MFERVKDMRYHLKKMITVIQPLQDAFLQVL